MTTPYNAPADYAELTKLVKQIPRMRTSEELRKMILRFTTNVVYNKGPERLWYIPLCQEMMYAVCAHPLYQSDVMIKIMIQSIQGCIRGIRQIIPCKTQEEHLIHATIIQPNLKEWREKDVQLFAKEGQKMSFIPETEMQNDVETETKASVQNVVGDLTHVLQSVKNLF